MKMITVGPDEGSAWSFGRKVARSLAELESPARLAIVFLPISAPHAKFLEAIADGVNVPVIGATTGGAAFTERGVSSTGAACAVLGGDDLEIASAVARNIRQDPRRSVESAMAEIHEIQRSWRLESGKQTSLLVLADAFACDGEELVACLRQSVPLHCRIFGGTAGDDWTFQGTRIFAGRESLSDAAVLVYMVHRHKLTIDVHHGWCLAEGAREFRITDIDKNVLKTLDGRPAAEVYREELTRLGLLASGEELLQAIAKHELGTRTPFGEQLKIRAPLGIGEDGSITLASSLSRGQTVGVVTTSPERLIEAAKTLSSRVFATLPRVSGALVFDCAARRRLLGDRYAEEVRAFQSPDGHPLFGMACYGEIAKYGGQVEAFHNTTAVMAAF